MGSCLNCKHIAMTQSFDGFYCCLKRVKLKVTRFQLNLMGCDDFSRYVLEE